MFIATAAIGGLNTKVTFITSDATNTNQTTYTSPSFSTLTANARRLIIIGFRCTNLTATLTAPSSCTVTPNVGSAVAATKILQNPVGPDALAFEQIWAAQVPTGTSATVAITRAANMTGQVAIIWVGENLKSSTVVGSVISSLADPASASLTVQAPGFAVGMGVATSAGSFAWTNLTEDVDSDISNVSYTGAHQSKVTGSSLLIGLDTDVNCRILAASWR